MKNFLNFILLALLLTSCGEYVRLQKEKERDGLFWDMRVKFDYLKNDRTAQYVRVGDISVRDSVLDVEVLRTYFYSKGNSRYGGFDALKKVAREIVRKHK